jgi:hypothetical protein
VAKKKRLRWISTPGWRESPVDVSFGFNLSSKLSSSDFPGQGQMKPEQLEFERLRR